MEIVNDISQLNPIQVNSIVYPKSTDELIDIVKNCNTYISISGGNYSMGGQTATKNSLHIDMKGFNKILSFSKQNMEITVQAGIDWRTLQEFIDKYDLSVKIKQTYSNFTVGGSLSVNCHGRYIGQGAIIKSVKQIKIVLANGNLITANRNSNRDIFNGAIGGYGGLGIIAEITLSLTKNDKVERVNTVMPRQDYVNYFAKEEYLEACKRFPNADIHVSR